MFHIQEKKYLKLISIHMTQSRVMLKVCPEVSTKIWRFMGCCKLTFNLIFGILRCSDFRICINYGGLKWTVWPWENIFSQKVPKNHLFWRTRFLITWLWRGLAPTILKIMTFFTGVLKNMGHLLSDEPWADLLASKLSDWQPFEIFFGAAMENCRKRRFLLKTLLLDIFWWENFSRIGPCESSLPEVSENVVLLGRASFLTGVIAAQSQQTLKFRVRHQK